MTFRSAPHRSMLGRAVFPAVLLASASFQFAPLNATAQDSDPPRIEVTESSNPRHGDPQAIEEGRAAYFKYCVQCHGPGADGTSPRFGKYAGDLRKFWRGYGEFLAIVLNGRPKKQMPPWAEYLNQNDIAAIGAFLETLAVEGANWK